MVAARRRRRARRSAATGSSSSKPERTGFPPPRPLAWRWMSAVPEPIGGGPQSFDNPEISQAAQRASACRRKSSGSGTASRRCSMPRRPRPKVSPPRFPSPRPPSRATRSRRPRCRSRPRPISAPAPTTCAPSSPDFDRDPRVRQAKGPQVGEATRRLDARDGRPHRQDRRADRQGRGRPRTKAEVRIHNNTEKMLDGLLDRRALDRRPARADPPLRPKKPARPQAPIGPIGQRPPARIAR